MKTKKPLLPLRPLRLCGEHSYGFTLVELMIVMVVITVLVGVTIPIAKYVTRRAREANQRIYIEKIKSALEDYRAAYGEYPITPPNEGAARHYPANYDTTIFDTNSASISVPLAANNVESVTDTDPLRQIDYSLTYPLMLRQRAEGARPFMEFKNITVAYLVYRAPVLEDIFDVTTRRKSKGGAVDYIYKQGLYGKPIIRPEAIDPVTMKQWWYTSADGLTYTLTNHPDF